MNKKYFFALLMSVSVFMVSCDKEDIIPFVNVTSAPDPVTPSYPSGYDLYNFINTATIIRVPGTNEATETKFYTAGAFSYNGNGGFNDLGVVSVEGKVLKKQSNNSYLYTDVTKPLTPDGPVDWEVGGQVYTTAKSIPSLKSLDKPGAIDLSKGSLLIESRNCDKILVVLTDGEGKSMTKTFEGATVSAVLTIDELAGLSATDSGFLQITPYNYEQMKVNDRDAVLGNQTTYSFTGVTFK